MKSINKFTPHCCSILRGKNVCPHFQKTTPLIINIYFSALSELYECHLWQKTTRLNTNIFFSSKSSVVILHTLFELKLAYFMLKYLHYIWRNSTKSALKLCAYFCAQNDASSREICTTICVLKNSITASF